LYDSPFEVYVLLLILELDWLFNRYAGDAEPQDLDNPAVEELSINSNTGMDYTLLPPKNAMESFEDAFSMFSSTVTDRDFSLYKFTRYRAHYNCLAKGVELPHSILRGPWTEETIQYLFWIMVAGGELNWTTSTTGEVRTNRFSTSSNANEHADRLARLQRRGDGRELKSGLAVARDGYLG